MAFVVETGAGLSNANSFVSVEYADQYFSDRGNSSWAMLSLPSKESALIKATDYIVTKYYNGFAGTEEFPLTQNLPFPRVDIPNQSDNMPELLLKSTCEYAFVSTSTSLFQSDVAKGYPVKKYKTEVGPILEETEYDTSKTFNVFALYVEADLLIKPLLKKMSYSNVVLRN